MLGKFDPPREHSNNILMSTISTMGALAGTAPGGKWSDDSDKVEPPLLGHLVISDPAITKELYFYLGLPMGEKYKPGGKRSLKFYLQGVASKITMMKLCSESAYSLLLTVLEGSLYDEVYRMQHAKVPFYETWRYIQNCSSGQASDETLAKELADLFKSKPVYIYQTLSQIHDIRIQLCNKIKNKKNRESVINVTTMIDYKNLLEQFYGPTVTAAIETLFAHEVAKHEKEQQLYESQGVPYKSSFDEIRCFKEIACRHINQLVKPSKGPSLLFASNMEVEQDNNMAVLISSLQAASTARASGPTTSLPSVQSQPSVGTSQMSGSVKGSKRTGSVSGRSQNKQQRSNDQNMTVSGLPSDQSAQLQAAINAKQMKLEQAKQEMMKYASQPASSFPIPDFAKLLLPIERLMIKRNRSEVPDVCWNTIGNNVCFLCAVKNHFYDECPLYPGQLPGTTRCSCMGYHQSECRVHLRRLMDVVTKEGWSVPPPPAPRQMAEGYNGGRVQYDPPRNNGGQRPNNNGWNRDGTGNGNGNRPRYQGNGNGGRGGNGNYNNNNNNRNYNNGGNRFDDRRDGGRGRGNGNYNNGNDRNRNYNNDNGGNYRDRQDNRDGNRYGFPDQSGGYTSGAPLDGAHLMDGVNPAGQAANRQGGGLGNSGSQMVPEGVQMSAAEITHSNN